MKIKRYNEDDRGIELTDYLVELTQEIKDEGYKVVVFGERKLHMGEEVFYFKVEIKVDELKNRGRVIPIIYSDNIDPILKGLDEFNSLSQLIKDLLQRIISSGDFRIMSCQMLTINDQILDLRLRSE